MNRLQRYCLLPVRSGIFNQPSTSQIPRLITLSNTRTFFLPKKMPKMERVEIKYRIKDKMPSSTILVYNNPSAFWIEPLFHFQNVCLIGGIVFMVNFLRGYLNGDITFPLSAGEYFVAKKPIEAVGFVGVTGFIFLFSSLACKFSVFRVYFDKATNVNKAVLVGYLPFLKRMINIKPRSVTPVERRFPIKDFRTFEYKVNGTRVFLYENYFRRPEDLNKMIKYN